MDARLKLFRHTHTDHNKPQTLFLLHGTGGTMHDFLFLDHELGEQFNIVGLQGNIVEDGLNRFFRRQAPMVFDQENIKEEAGKLDSFLDGWRKTFPEHTKKLVFLGYSNGANLLLAMLFLYPEKMNHFVLLHPMLPFTPDVPINLENHQVFISIGKKDLLIPPAKGEAVVHVLKTYGAQVKLKKYPTGHEVRPPEIKDAVDFLLKL